MATEIKHAIRTQSAWDGMDPGEQAQYNGHYISLIAWNAAQARNLVSADEIAVAVIFDDWPGSGVVANYPSVEIGPSWTMDSSHYCVWQAAAGAEFDPITKVGARLIRKPSDTAFGIVVRSGKRLYGYDLGITIVALNGVVYESGDLIEFSRCNIYDSNYRALQSGNFHVSDSLIEISEATIQQGASPTYMTLTNVILIQPNGTGSYNGDIAAHNSEVNNVAIFNGNVKTTYDSFWTCSSSSGHNAQNDNGSGNPPGTDPVLNLTTLDFVDYAGGDYHPENGGVLNLTGLLSTSTLDLDRLTWATGDQNIGCYSTSGGAGPSPVKKVNTLLLGQDF